MIVGMALVEPGRFDDGEGELDPALLHISMVFVRPDLQRTGVGLPLLLYIFEVARSLVANGAVVRGRVFDSVLFPGAVVERGASVTSSIVFQDTIIGPGAQVDLAILDKQVRVGEGAVVGYGEARDGEADAAARSSILTVGKQAVVPPGVRLGRRCVVDVGACPEDFPSSDLAPGTFVPATVARGAAPVGP